MEMLKLTKVPAFLNGSKLFRVQSEKVLDWKILKFTQFYSIFFTLKPPLKLSSGIEQM